METLIECTCGHAISHHSPDGCRGIRLRPCSCAYNESEVLEHALTAVRTQYGQWTEARLEHL